MYVTPIETDKKRLYSLHVIIIIIVWSLVQLFLFDKYGIFTELEAAKYIGEANTLLATGSVSSANFWFYSTQIFLIALSKKLHLTLYFVYGVQLLLSLFATITFFKFLKQKSDSKTSTILTCFLLLNLPLQTFNSFLQTESIFYSLTLIYSCYLLDLDKVRCKKRLLLILLLVIIVFTRPTGLLFLPASLVFVIFKFINTTKRLLVILVSTVSIFLFTIILNIALKSGGQLNFMLPFREEHIICGVPGVIEPIKIDALQNGNSLEGLFYYITHNFSQFTRLALEKTKYFFSPSRNYYSKSHNLYLLIYFYSMYAFAFFSVRLLFFRNKSLLAYILTIFITFWISVVLTCDDWHNRFILSISPYFIMLSFPLVSKMTNKLNRSKK